LIRRSSGCISGDDNALVIKLRRGTVLAVTAERPGAVELSVEIDGERSAAIAYPGLTGPVGPGDRVLLNTTAVALGLGTGGYHFVLSVEGSLGPESSAEGRTMKLRYTPQQVNVLVAEEQDSPHRALMAEADGLDGAPVVWVPLHSMIGLAAAGAVAAGAERVAYVMTDGAALPAALSRLSSSLRDAELLRAVVTTGQAFGGDVETVNVFTGLLAARHLVKADVVIVGDGPGNTGTGTPWGATDIESAMSLNAAAILGGRPVAALRMSFVDPRKRHRGVSHHSLTALGRVALAPVHVAIPSIEDEGRRAQVWDAVRAAGLEERHQLIEVTGQPALDILADRGIEVRSMGRGVEDDPEFFLAAGAAGVLAARMAAGDREWRVPP
jgi:hypothetical protein